jgi:hypothetical protein
LPVMKVCREAVVGPVGGVTAVSVHPISTRSAEMPSAWMELDYGAGALLDPVAEADVLDRGGHADPDEAYLGRRDCRGVDSLSGFLASL